jgi:predicted DNA-binding transcriptional regulator AlpA
MTRAKEMTRHTPILASEAKAAELLDMTVDTFRKLVKEGHLPPGRLIGGGLVRWDTDQLRRIGRGEAADGMDDVRW